MISAAYCLLQCARKIWKICDRDQNGVLLKQPCECNTVLVTSNLSKHDLRNLTVAASLGLQDQGQTSGVQPTFSKAHCGALIHIESLQRFKLSAPSTSLQSYRHTTTAHYNIGPSIAPVPDGSTVFHLSFAHSIAVDCSHTPKRLCVLRDFCSLRWLLRRNGRASAALAPPSCS